MHAVRKHILEILKENDGATVAELAERLTMAPVSVRHHLDILQGDGLICVDRVQRKGCVGRPQQVYELTEEATDYFPNNFAALAGKLAHQLKQVLPPEQIPGAFRAMAQEIASELEEADESAATLPDHLTRVAEFLTERGYLARWEPVSTNPADGYLLHKCNCPYAGVAGEHRELCLMDQALVDELLGQSCLRLQSMADDARCCSYQVQELPADGSVRNEIPLVGMGGEGASRL